MANPVTLVVHTSNEDMFFAMMNAQSKAHVAEDQKIRAETERDLAVCRMIAAEKEMQRREENRILRNRFIRKAVLFGTCAAGCVMSSVACICNGLWYAAIAPTALIAVSAWNLRK